MEVWEGEVARGGTYLTWKSIKKEWSDISHLGFQAGFEPTTIQIVISIKLQYHSNLQLYIKFLRFKFSNLQKLIKFPRTLKNPISRI